MPAANNLTLFLSARIIATILCPAFLSKSDIASSVCTDMFGCVNLA
jgi:hypothetical protein